MHRLPVIAIALLFAGCIGAQKEAPAVVPQPSKAMLSASLPTVKKDSFMTQQLPVMVPLAPPTETKYTIDVPAGLSGLQVSIDLAPTVPQTTSATAKLLAPNGTAAFEIQPAADQAKGIAQLDWPAAGKYVLDITSTGSWTVGVVTVTIPGDYTPGYFVNVSHPEQRKVDHTWEPAQVKLHAGETARFTIFDFDPHAGIDNLQHNLFIPAINAKTEGQTTWGVVKTLDFTAPTQPGTYPFYCEFHEKQLKGLLIVV